eukprot:6509810-Prorocentrum_lima.AAC.1
MNLITVVKIESHQDPNLVAPHEWQHVVGNETADTWADEAAGWQAAKEEEVEQHMQLLLNT